MFKVLIVDDENIIRRGLKNIIDWKNLECEICGEASDGVEGIEKIREFLPEIIITDIHMSGLDGLKMIKETKDLVPHCKIIILTGYRNFEYIKEALSLGAFDYILKPSKIDEITSIVKKAVAKLKLDLKKEEELKTIKSNFEDALPLLRQKLLYDIMFNINDQQEDIIKQLKSYNLDLNNFLLIVVEINESIDSNGFIEKQTYQFGIINLFEDIFSEDFTVFNVPINKKQVAFLIMSAKDFDFTEKAYENSENLEKNIKSCFNININIAISTLGTNVLELHNKTKETLEMLQHKELMGKKSVLLYEDKTINSTLQKAVEYINLNYSKPITLNKIAEYTYVSSYYLSRLFTKHLGNNFIDYLNEIRIEKAKEYLKDTNYKAYEVAELVGINDAHYFSKIFKKYTGKTPSEYKNM